MSLTFGCAAKARSVSERVTRCVVKVMTSASEIITLPPLPRSHSSPLCSIGSMAWMTLATSSGVNTPSSLTKPSASKARNCSLFRRRSVAGSGMRQTKSWLKGCGLIWRGSTVVDMGSRFCSPSSVVVSKFAQKSISGSEANFGTETTLGFNELLVSLDCEIRRERDIEVKRISQSDNSQHNRTQVGREHAETRYEGPMVRRRSRQARDPARRQSRRRLQGALPWRRHEPSFRFLRSSHGLVHRSALSAHRSRRASRSPEALGLQLPAPLDDLGSGRTCGARRV